MEEKRSKGQEGKVEEDAAQAEHFQVWDRFWGRPGYGAPRQSGQNKENLMKMLHYPKQVTQSQIYTAIIIILSYIAIFAHYSMLLINKCCMEKVFMSVVQFVKLRHGINNLNQGSI